MFTKVLFTVKINAQVLLKLFLFKLKFSGRCDVFLFYEKKKTSSHFLLGSGLKVIFHWFAQTFVLRKSLFKLVADTLILSTTEKKIRLFMQIKNSNKPRIDPYGMPVSVLDLEDSWPFNITLWEYLKDYLI